MDTKLVFLEYLLTTCAVFKINFKDAHGFVKSIKLQYSIINTYTVHGGKKRTCKLYSDILVSNIIINNTLMSRHTKQ
jgi:hypothetical protein